MPGSPRSSAASNCPPRVRRRSGRRVSAAFDPFHHDALRRARADRLGRLGLSAAKIKTLKNLARELAAERLESRSAGERGRRRRAQHADRAARHRPLDRRRLSAVLPRPWRCVAGRRSRRAGSGQDRAWAEDAADREGDGAAGGAVASDARRRGASVVDLLQGAEKARGRDRRRRPKANAVLNKLPVAKQSSAKAKIAAGKKAGIETMKSTDFIVARNDLQQCK